VRKWSQAVRSQNKYLLTPDTHFVEELGDDYVLDLTRQFYLWSGAFSPFFVVEHVKDEEDPEGFKVARQVRPLPLRDQHVAAELKNFLASCKTMENSVTSCKEVNQSGPLRTILAALKKPLLKSLFHFREHGLRGIFRRHFYDLQPGAPYVWDTLQSLQI